MTRIPQLNTGKMEAHGKPLGVNSPAELETRAREIAQINGRAEPTVDDRAQARRELGNGALPPGVTEDAEAGMQSLSRDPSDPATDRGRQTPEYIELDEEQMVERLALEGVEEAQHDLMVEGRNTDVGSDADADLSAPGDGVRRRRARP